MRCNRGRNARLALKLRAQTTLDGEEIDALTGSS
jgi:hypothetical protein